MSIATTVRTAGPFAGTGSLVALPFAFKVFAAADLVVQRTSASGSVTTLTLTTHYSVSLNADQDTSPGGTVTLVTALAVGETAVVTSDVAATQPLQLASGGPFLPKQIEDALDRAMVVMQQLGVMGEQALRVPIGETAAVLPSAALRAGTTLHFDASGNPYVAPPGADSAVALAADLASGSSGRGAGMVAYTGPGSGAISTTVEARLRRGAVSPMDFGAVGDAVADDTAAINLAYSAAKALGRALDLSNRFYKITSPLLIDSNSTLVFGAGKGSGLIASTDIDLIRVDIGGRITYANQFRDFELRCFAAATTGACIRYYDSLGTQQGGGTHGIFSGLWFDHAHGIVFDRAHLGGFAPSWPEVADYGHFQIEGCNIPYNAGKQQTAVWFKGGPGAHNRIANNNFQAADACIRMGGSDEGLGDQIIIGNHLTDGAYAVDIIGPTTGGRYNQNVTITGNQFDGITTNTVRMARMQNFRIGSNNSTTSVGIDISTCTGTYWAEDRGFLQYTGTMTKLSSITTTSSPLITDTSGWRWGSDVLARRSDDTNRLIMVGGSVFGNGAALMLYGGAHATEPSRAFVDTNRFRVRSQNGSATLLDVNSSGSAIGFFGAAPITKPVITGAKGGNAALTSLLSQLASMGLITDSTT